MPAQQSKRLFAEFPPTTKNEWRAEVEATLKGKPFEKAIYHSTYENITLKGIYDRTDNHDLTDNLPGIFPYSRSTNGGGYLSKGWLLSQETETSLSLQNYNENLMNALHRGQNSINIGLNCDALAANLACGSPCGLKLYNLTDLEVVLKNIELEYVNLDIFAFLQALPYAGMLAALAKKRSYDLKKLQGAVLSDPLGYLSSFGNMPLAITTAYDEMAELTNWAKDNAPHIRTIGVQVMQYQFAGGNAVDELTYALATARIYLEEMLQRNLKIEEIASKFHFTLSVGGNFFMELAKFRAFRVLWANLLKAYGCPERLAKAFIHGRTTVANKTVFDPYVNMLRSTTEAFSAVLGGVDSLQVGSFDEIIGMPNEFSLRYARNVQVILAEECHLDSLIDPAGGSWYIESLTEELIDKAWDKFADLEEQGGIFKALKSGSLQTYLRGLLSKRTENIATRKDVFVGTNMYANLQEKSLEKVDEPATEKYVPCTKDYHPAKFADYIAYWEDGADIFAVRKTNKASDLKIEPLYVQRLTAEFENIRQFSERYLQDNGKRPQVFSANFGPTSQYKARADFSRGFLETAGIEIIDSGSYADPTSAAAAFLKSEAEACVICSTDETYPALTPQFIEIVKKSKPKTVFILAGYPQDALELLKNSGVNVFIHIKANVQEANMQILNLMGIAK